MVTIYISSFCIRHKRLDDRYRLWFWTSVVPVAWIWLPTYSLRYCSMITCHTIIYRLRSGNYSSRSLNRANDWGVLRSLLDDYAA